MSNRTIIFARVSTKRQETEGLSLEEIQLPRARDYAKNENLNVVKEFKISETGSEYKARNKFQEMITYAKKNKITDIVSFRVDRMTRNFRDSVMIDDLRKKHKVRLHFIDDRLVLSQESRSSDIIQWDFKVMFAKSQLERIKEDGMNTKLSKLERGELPWTAPYGYKNISLDARHKTVQPEDFTSEVVKLMFKYFATGAYSCESLRRKVNKELGTNLSKSRIHNILRDKFYIGVIVDHKGGGKEYVHNYQQIISRDLFDMVQDILDGNRNGKRRFVGKAFIYRGLITCTDCGCAVTTEYREKKQKNGNEHSYHFYHCTNARKAHKKLTYITEDELTKQFKQVFQAFKEIPQEEVERLQVELQSAHKDENRFQDDMTKKLRSDKDDYQNRIRVAFDAMTGGSITPDDYAENKARYEQEIGRIKQQMERLEEADRSFYLTASYLLQLFKHGDKIFEVATHEEKRELLKLVLSNLNLKGKTVRFTPNEPFATVLKLSERSTWQGLRDALCNPDLPIEIIDFVVKPLLEKYGYMPNLAPA